MSENSHVLLITYSTDSPFDLERCGPAIDIGLERINREFLDHHKVFLNKVQKR
jgi:atrial natriuretic peptide receptor A